MKQLIALVILVFYFQFSYAQETDAIKAIGNRIGNIGNANPGRKDTIGFEHRNDKKDSISITYKYLDSIRSIPFDSSINDFDKYFSVPSSYLYMGNHGAAAYSLIYMPNAKPGWDAGFHAFDVYRYTLEGSKFYKTNRPFSQLSYQIASGKEQMIKVFHTQSPKPNWSFGFDYRLISAPGFFVNQNANHKNYRLFSNYQGKRKRYAAFFIMVGNTIKNSENGGIRFDSSLSDPNQKDRFTVDVHLGNDYIYKANPFNTTVNTGNVYKDFTIFVRQTYDIGKKDSIAINDTTTEYLFYPKLRAQHSFTYSTYNYLYKDNLADSAFYASRYDTIVKRGVDSFLLKDKWTVMGNDFTLLSFPDTKNPGQFISAGVKFENIKGALKTGTKNFYNFIIHGEYRNKTRNKRWDVLAKVEFYVTGVNNGDYSAYATIARHINHKLGDIRLFFKNVNRSPSFIFDNASSFNLKNGTLTKKENIISFGADAINRFINLGFKNHLITNLSYFTDYYHTAQSSKVINLLQVYASKKIKITKRWNLYADITFQQTDGGAPIKVPLLFTRNRLAYEGVFFKNLNLSTGLEVRYFTPFESYNYSPVMGQFAPQDTFKLKNLPDISAFLHFRIKSFTAFIRAENLNTVSLSNGFDFTNNNFAAPHYPTQGFMLRFGIQWGFVN
ncbi:MAG: putative porin [Ferruginibacter sp.]